MKIRGQLCIKKHGLAVGLCISINMVGVSGILCLTALVVEQSLSPASATLCWCRVLLTMR